jgi:hypothetical protein
MMQVTVFAKDGAEMAEAIYRTVASEEIKRMKAKYEEEIDDLTMAHKLTESKLSYMQRKDLEARKAKRTKLEQIRNRMAEAWGVLWGLMLEFELIAEEDE